MVVKGKKRRDAAGRFDRTATYSPAEAIGLVKALASASFDESVEAALSL
ncbi:MAG: 50S ribosomal protein L1, partial [Actinobacteria bacterium]|nr:50S ribosomal protein L1 [Actinomycetota bacterium]NIS36074.1 50S ribosomal protein L1 [Actinomycetota bacterium]NIT98515.1 50S ribosomal protein L1 [Actinomycetota bacterium]NIU22131.1 50S ribosomal protein L1 [Actinomycetota bacterium]NIU70649.1 50S ribosomal protein L1 [Actinomycetota bacterium]